MQYKKGIAWAAIPLFTLNFFLFFILGIILPFCLQTQAGYYMESQSVLE